MCTSTEDCFCHEHVRTSRWPYSTYAQRISFSADISSTSGSGSGSAGAVATEQHLLQRVAPEPEAERLERDDFVGRDVAEVHLGAEVLDEPRLRTLRRGLPDQVLEVERVFDLVDEARPELAGRSVDARGAALATLGDHLPRARIELLAYPLHPQIRRDVDRGVLRADLGEDDEVTRELCDQLELAVARDLDRAIRDLDVGEAVLLQPDLECIELAACIDSLEERPAADDRRPERPVERDLLLEVVRDVARAPAELDDVDELARSVEEALDVTEVQALVHDVRESTVARLRLACRDFEPRSVRGGHRAPPASSSRSPGRRGRASCRGRRCRRSAARSP